MALLASSGVFRAAAEEEGMGFVAKEVLGSDDAGIGKESFPIKVTVTTVTNGDIEEEGLSAAVVGVVVVVVAAAAAAA